MSARHALLGLLRSRPAYPYELADRLQSRLGPAWAINSGQLYQTVRKLEADGLIERVDEAADTRDDRHVFAITEAGTDEFDNWFESSTPGVRLSRRSLLVKINLAGPERCQQTLAHIQTYETECAKRLAELTHCREEVHVSGPSVRADHVLLRLGLSADILALEAELQWAKHAQEMVSWLTDSPALWPSSGRPRDTTSEHEHDREDARRQMFHRMATRHLRSSPDASDAQHE